MDAANQGFSQFIKGLPAQAAADKRGQGLVTALFTFRYENITGHADFAGPGDQL